MRISKILGRLAFAASLAALVFTQSHTAFAQEPPPIPFTEPAGVADALAGLNDDIAALAVQIKDIYMHAVFCSQAEKNAAYKEIAADYDRLRELRQRLASMKSGAATLMTTPMGKSYFLNDSGPRPDETKYWLSAENGLKDDNNLISEARDYLSKQPVINCNPPPSQPVEPGPPPGPVVPPPKQMPALPPAPSFDLTPLALPPCFNSEQEWRDYRFNVMWPYIQAMRAQASAWAHYDYELSVLASQYSGDPDIYWYIRKADDAAEAKAGQARDYADDVEKDLPGQMGKIPTHCSHAVPQEPGTTGGPVEGGWHGKPEDLPPPNIPIPAVPDCFKSADEKSALISQIQSQIDQLEASQMTPGDAVTHDQIQANIEAMRGALKRAKETGLCDKPGLLDGLQIGIGIGLGGGHGHRDDDRGGHRDGDDHPRTRDRTDDKPKTHDSKTTDRPAHDSDGGDRHYDNDNKAPNKPKHDSDDNVRKPGADSDVPRF